MSIELVPGRSLWSGNELTTWPHEFVWSIVQTWGELVVALASSLTVATGARPVTTEHTGSVTIPSMQIVAFMKALDEE